MSEYKPYFTIFSTKTAKATTLAAVLAGFSCIIGGILLLIYFTAKSHLPLQTKIAGVALGNMEIKEAKEVLLEKYPRPPETTISIMAGKIQVASSSSELGAYYEIDDAINTLTEVPTETPLHWKVYTVIRRYLTPQDISLRITYKKDKIESLVSALKIQADKPALPPKLILKTPGNPASLSVFAGEVGSEIPLEKTTAAFIETLESGVNTFETSFSTTGTVLTEQEQAENLERGKKYVGKSVRFTREGIPFTLKDTEMISLLALPSGIHEKEALKFIASWEKAVNRKPQEPELEIDETTLQVKKFVAPRAGLTVNSTENITALKKLLLEIEANQDSQKTNFETPLVLAELPPKKSLGELNKLGIEERIGFGESYYAHSIPNRIHNVALAASRVSLSVIKPGEEFSFNKHLGEVSGATGFKSAYVIQGNKTVLGDGGGVCQVSTTLFRSVLNAGLPVTRRLPHSYRVSYYELDRKPGIDATVYSGETDFRFKNDTGHYILVYGEADSKNLYMFFELYGTSDGRTAQIVDHKTWNFRAAPAPVYIPDPSLPPGKTVQVDWAAAGISASFKNIVKDKAGAVIREEEYVSHYRPWSAKYLKGIEQ